MSTVLSGEGSGQSTTTQEQGSGSGTTTSANAVAQTQTSGGAATASWRDTLPEELKGNGGLAQFKDVASLAKSYVHAQSLIGKKGVVVPTEKASDEEWKSFYKSVGQPDLDNFELKTPKDMEFNKETVAKFREKAHELGFLPKQAQGLLDWYIQHESETMTAKTSELDNEAKTQLANLQKEWGQGYDKQIALARLAVKDVGIDGFQEYLDSSGLGNDPMIIKAMASFGKLLGEDRLRGEAGGRFGKTPNEVKGEIADIRGNPKHPYFDHTHPGHRNAVSQMEDLYKQLSG